ncbi:hypothetical protein BC828DRAFT_402200 [Blastocladiella britannica]|nr:hypothetical protein BC828DRAFT_402200 [Blastocladiella britannica]
MAPVPVSLPLRASLDHPLQHQRQLGGGRSVPSPTAAAAAPLAPLPSNTSLSKSSSFSLGTSLHAAATAAARATLHSSAGATATTGDRIRTMSTPVSASPTRLLDPDASFTASYRRRPTSPDSPKSLLDTLGASFGSSQGRSFSQLENSSNYAYTWRPPALESMSVLLEALNERSATPPPPRPLLRSRLGSSAPATPVRGRSVPTPVDHDPYHLVHEGANILRSRNSSRDSISRVADRTNELRISTPALSPIRWAGESMRQHHHSPLRGAAVGDSSFSMFAAMTPVRAAPSASFLRTGSLALSLAATMPAPPRGDETDQKRRRSLSESSASRLAVIFSAPAVAAATHHFPLPSFAELELVEVQRMYLREQFRANQLELVIRDTRSALGGVLLESLNNASLLSALSSGQPQPQQQQLEAVTAGGALQILRQMHQQLQLPGTSTSSADESSPDHLQQSLTTASPTTQAFNHSQVTNLQAQVQWMEAALAQERALRYSLAHQIEEIQQQQQLGVTVGVAQEDKIHEITDDAAASTTAGSTVPSSIPSSRDRLAQLEMANAQLMRENRAYAAAVQSSSTAAYGAVVGQAGRSVTVRERVFEESMEAVYGVKDLRSCPTAQLLTRLSDHKAAHEMHLISLLSVSSIPTTRATTETTTTQAAPSTTDPEPTTAAATSETAAPANTRASTLQEAVQVAHDHIRDMERALHTSSLDLARTKQLLRRTRNSSQSTIADLHRSMSATTEASTADQERRLAVQAALDAALASRDELAVQVSGAKERESLAELRAARFEAAVHTVQDRLESAQEALRNADAAKVLALKDAAATRQAESDARRDADLARRDLLQLQQQHASVSASVVAATQDRDAAVAELESAKRMVATLSANLDAASKELFSALQERAQLQSAQSVAKEAVQAAKAQAATALASLQPAENVANDLGLELDAARTEITRLTAEIDQLQQQLTMARQQMMEQHAASEISQQATMAHLEHRLKETQSELARQEAAHQRDAQEHAAQLNIERQSAHDATLQLRQQLSHASIELSQSVGMAQMEAVVAKVAALEALVSSKVQEAAQLAAQLEQSTARGKAKELECAELASQLKSRDARLETTATDMASLTAQLARAAASESAAQQQASVSAYELSALEVKCRAVEDQLAHEQSKLSAQATLAKDLESQLGNKQEALAKSDAALADVHALVDALNTTISSLHQQVQQHEQHEQQQRAAQQAKAEAARHALAAVGTAQQQVDSLGADLAAVKLKEAAHVKQLNRIKEHARRLALRISRLEDERVELAARIDEERDDAKALGEELAIAQEHTVLLQAALETAHGRIHTLEQAAASRASPLTGGEQQQKRSLQQFAQNNNGNNDSTNDLAERRGITVQQEKTTLRARNVDLEQQVRELTETLAGANGNVDALMQQLSVYEETQHKSMQAMGVRVTDASRILEPDEFVLAVGERVRKLEARANDAERFVEFIAAERDQLQGQIAALRRPSSHLTASPVRQSEQNGVAIKSQLPASVSLASVSSLVANGSTDTLLDEDTGARIQRALRSLSAAYFMSATAKAMDIIDEVRSALDFFHLNLSPTTITATGMSLSELKIALIAALDAPVATLTQLKTALNAPALTDQELVETVCHLIDVKRDSANKQEVTEQQLVAAENRLSSVLTEGELVQEKYTALSGAWNRLLADLGMHERVNEADLESTADHIVGRVMAANQGALVLAEQAEGRSLQLADLDCEFGAFLATMARVVGCKTTTATPTDAESVVAATTQLLANYRSARADAGAWQTAFGQVYRAACRTVPGEHGPCPATADDPAIASLVRAAQVQADHQHLLGITVASDWPALLGLLKRHGGGAGTTLRALVTQNADDALVARHLTAKLRAICTDLSASADDSSNGSTSGNEDDAILMMEHTRRTLHRALTQIRRVQAALFKHGFGSAYGANWVEATERALDKVGAAAHTAREHRADRATPARRVTQPASSLPSPVPSSPIRSSAVQQAMLRAESPSRALPASGPTMCADCRNAHTAVDDARREFQRVYAEYAQQLGLEPSPPAATASSSERAAKAKRRVSLGPELVRALKALEKVE